MNANSQMYTRQPNQCEFTLSAFESVSGELDSPKHTLPPNTVCRYHFQGRRHEIVWIIFTKYHASVDQSVFEAPTECFPQLRIWDGKLRSKNTNGKYSTKKFSAKGFVNTVSISFLFLRWAGRECSKCLISSRSMSRRCAKAVLPFVNIT